MWYPRVLLKQQVIEVEREMQGDKKDEKIKIKNEFRKLHHQLGGEENARTQDLFLQC